MSPLWGRDDWKLKETQHNPGRSPSWSTYQEKTLESIYEQWQPVNFELKAWKVGLCLVSVFSSCHSFLFKGMLQCINATLGSSTLFLQISSCGGSIWNAWFQNFPARVRFPASLQFPHFPASLRFPRFPAACGFQRLQGFQPASALRDWCLPQKTHSTTQAAAIY